MESTLAMRKLLRVRALQRERLERAVNQEQASLREAQDQAALAQQEQLRCEAVESAAVDCRNKIFSSDFVACDIESTDLYIANCSGVTAQAARVFTQAQALVLKQSASLKAAVRLLDRNIEQAKQLEMRLAEALQKAAELAEDAESDEAGELAVARNGARRRQSGATA